MPSLIGADAGTGINVAGNYRRAFAPFARFGTRQLGFFEISMDLSQGTLVDEEIVSFMDPAYVSPYDQPVHEIEYQADGVFQRAIQAVETRGEIYAIFRPGSYYNGVDGNEPDDGNTFVVLLAVDTANIGSTNTPENDMGNPGNYNDNSGSIAQAVSDACDCDVQVTQLRMKGSYFRFSDLNGLETNRRAGAKSASARRGG
jgi:hypothetical protein